MDETQTELPIETKPKELIQLTARRSLAPKNQSELVRVIEKLHQGKGFPERFDTPEKRLAAYSLANSLMGDRWQMALNNIAVIKGQMTIYGELPSALAEQTKEVAEKRVFLVDKEYNEICLKNKNFEAEPYAAVCIIQRKGRAKKEFFYTVDDAKRAGQLPAAESSPWNKYRKVMLLRKANALGIKFEFPDALIGSPIAEYDHDIAPDLPGTSRDVVDTTLVDELNSYADSKNEITQ